MEGEESPVARLVDANAYTVAKVWGQMEGLMFLYRIEKRHIYVGFFRSKGFAGSRVRWKPVIASQNCGYKTQYDIILNLSNNQH